MPMTAGQLWTEITANLGNRTDLDSRKFTVLNMVLDRIARLHDFDELRGRTVINTAVTGSAANDKFIALTPLGRYRKIYNIRLYASNTLDRKLIKVLPSRWDKIVPKAEYYSRRTPSHYLKWSTNEIELWPVPDIVYSMHFRHSNWPNILSDNSHVPILENMDDAIIHLADSYLALGLGNVERSNQFYRVFVNSIKDILDEDIEDYDTHIAQAGSELHSALSLGYDDPFVKSMP